MAQRTNRSGISGLHQADAVVLALLSGALLAVALLLIRELTAGGLNRWETNAVAAVGIALGFIQLWLAFRAVLALCLWAASGTLGWGAVPWTLPVWWLGTLPGAWLGLVLPDQRTEVNFLVLSLGLLICAAYGLTHVVQALETRVLAVSRR